MSAYNAKSPNEYVTKYKITTTYTSKIELNWMVQGDFESICYNFQGCFCGMILLRAIGIFHHVPSCGVFIQKTFGAREMRRKLAGNSAPKSTFFLINYTRFSARIRGN